MEVCKISTASSSTFSENLLRLATFSGFPRACPLFFSRLSSAGFSYHGKYDAVKCTACGLEISNWSGKEVPLLVHVQNSPSCPLVKQLLKNGENSDLIKGFEIKEDISRPGETSKSEQCNTALANCDNYGFIQKWSSGDWQNSSKTLRETVNRTSSDRKTSVNDHAHDGLDGVDSGYYSAGNLNSSLSSSSVSSSPAMSLLLSSSLIPYSNPRYPNKAILCERLKTFNTWPRNVRQTPEDLSRAGFFYTGINDLVRCFQCGGGLTSWESEDDPWVEHAQWFPECVFLRQNKGEEYIRFVQSVAKEELPKHQAVTNNSLANTSSDALGASASTSDELAASASASSEILNIEELVSVRSVKEMGYTIEQILPAYREAVHHYKTKTVSAVQLMETILKIEEQNYIDRHNPGHHNIPKADECKQRHNQNHSTNQSCENETRGQQVSEALYMEPESNTPDNQMACGQMEAKTDECKGVTNHINPDILLCKVCMEEQVSVVFLPCGHLSTCGQCAPAMKKCPICREYVKGTVKTYLS